MSGAKESKMSETNLASMSRNIQDEKSPAQDDKTLENMNKVLFQKNDFDNKSVDNIYDEPQFVPVPRDTVDTNMVDMSLVSFDPDRQSEQ